MSATPAPFDPYRSPAMPEGPFEYRPSTTRPGWLTSLCVICIVIGALGLMNSLFGAVGVVGGKQLQRALQPKPGAGMNPEMQKAQNEFQAEMNSVQDKYFTPLVLSLTFRFVAALLLLIGGLMTLNLKESGRKVLLAALGLAIAFELSHAILQSIINTETMTALNSYFENMMSTLPQGRGAPPPGFDQTMRTVMRGSIIGWLAMFYLLVLAKCGFYLFGLVYLQKKHVRGLFTPDGSSAART